jgi:hypothetical protein
MPKVLCTLPNASEEISGIKFMSHAAGMLSEDISDEQAAKFASIQGYEIVGAIRPKDPSVEDEAKAAERAGLVERAEVVGLRVKGNWSVERLRTEVETAEKAKAAEGGEQA